MCGSISLYVVLCECCQCYLYVLFAIYWPCSVSAHQRVSASSISIWLISGLLTSLSLYLLAECECPLISVFWSLSLCLCLPGCECSLLFGLFVVSWSVFLCLCLSACKLCLCSIWMPLICLLSVSELCLFYSVCCLLTLLYQRVSATLSPCLFYLLPVDSISPCPRMWVPPLVCLSLPTDISLSLLARMWVPSLVWALFSDLSLMPSLFARM